MLSNDFYISTIILVISIHGITPRGFDGEWLKLIKVGRKETLSLNQKRQH
jgi:hypothetical protein